MYNKPKSDRQGGRDIGENVTRLEIMVLLLLIKALLESDNLEKALEMIGQVLEEAKKT